MSQLPRHVRPGQRLLGKVFFPDILHLVSRVSSGAPEQLSLHRVSCWPITSMTSCWSGPVSRKWQSFRHCVTTGHAGGWERNPTELAACCLVTLEGPRACLGHFEAHIWPFLLLKKMPDAQVLCFCVCVCVCVLTFTSLHGRSVQFSSVAQSCPTLCDPMNCCTPGLRVHHQLPEFTETHVHRVSDAIQPSPPLSSLLLLSPIPPSITPPMSQLFA